MKLLEILGIIKNIPLVSLDHLKVSLSDPTRVDHWRKLIRAGEKLAPIQLIKLPDGSEHLQDGNHRLQAYRDERTKEVPVQLINASDMSSWKLK
jgi:hypothetical protein